MEAVLPVEIEIGSLRVALEHQISETEWAQSRYDQFILSDERRLRATDHVQAYQRKMTRALRKRVRLRKFQKGDLVLKVLRGLINDPRGRFRPNWSGPYVIRDLTQVRSNLVDRLRRKSVHRASQCGSAEEVLRLRSWLKDGWPSF